ncbi:MAG: ubiquinone/menaquinone biosynthesis methyltransferase [Chloroflexi bacterium]|nr:ubiquinone/menaquinone biosynthesis methyltransferase [Chloroflexota bacterium]
MMMTPDERARRIQQMFGRIARRYDTMNRLMTMGRDQAWRKLTAQALQLPGGGAVLDLATGTGDLAFAVRDVWPGSRVTAMDFAYPMMQFGQVKQQARDDGRVWFAQGDALALPFADAQFDGVTNGFLLRNLVDLPGGLAEMRRVTKPGGRVACLEITRPQTPVFRELFGLYFYRLVPLLGGIIAGDLNAYTYLPNSLTKFPIAPDLKQLMLQTGFRDVQYRLRMLGTMALHVGVV